MSLVKFSKVFSGVIKRTQILKQFVFSGRKYFWPGSVRPHLDIPQEGRGHAEELPPDVGEGGDLPGGWGVEPVVVSGTEIDHDLVQSPTSPLETLAGG